MKGIILAGGSGTRLHPVTRVVSKQLLPVYDKPMIYYPLSILMLAGIREILIISTPRDLPMFETLLGRGDELGIQLHYAVQHNPNGLPEAFRIGEKFLDGGAGTLILGDNLFHGQGMMPLIRSAVQQVDHSGGACLFAYHVPDPERFGVIEFDAVGRVVSLEEKPSRPKSSYAGTGLYVCDATVVERVKKLKPSARGETEILDLARSYLVDGSLRVERFGRGIAWLDTGTHASLIDASNFIASIERWQGVKVACLEEIAYRQGYIGSDQLKKLSESTTTPGLRTYLNQILDETP